jgi:hypothetical protein
VYGPGDISFGYVTVMALAKPIPYCDRLAPAVKSPLTQIFNCDLFINDFIVMFVDLFVSTSQILGDTKKVFMYPWFRRILIFVGYNPPILDQRESELG